MKNCLTIGGVLLALLSVALTYNWRPREPARLEVGVIASFELLSMTEGFNLPLRVMWETRVGVGPPTMIDVESLSVSYILIRNAGEEPLDWEELVRGPIRFAFQDEGRVYRLRHVSLGDGTSMLPATTIIEPGWKSFTFECDFINPGERLLLEAVHSEGQLDVEGRIKGTGELQLLTFAGPRFTWRSSELQSLLLQAYVAFGLVAILLYLGYRRVAESRWSALGRSMQLAFVSSAGATATVIAALWLVGIELARHSTMITSTHLLVVIAVTYLALRYYMISGRSVLLVAVGPGSATSSVTRWKRKGNTGSPIHPQSLEDAACSPAGPKE